MFVPYGVYKATLCGSTKGLDIKINTAPIKTILLAKTKKLPSKIKAPYRIYQYPIVTETLATSPLTNKTPATTADTPRTNPMTKLIIQSNFLFGNVF